MSIGSFSGVKRLGRGVDHPLSPQLVPVLKEEQSYTSASPLGLRDLFCGERLFGGGS